MGKVNVLEHDGREAVAKRGQRNDPCALGGFQRRPQSHRQPEMAKMVRGKL
jgi:hypothetical protein